MRIVKLLGAALSLALVPGVAAAESNQDCPPSSATGGSGAAITGTLDANGNCICPSSPSGSAGVSSSGDLPAGVSGTSCTCPSPGKGGSGSEMGTMEQPTTEHPSTSTAPEPGTSSSSSTMAPSSPSTTEQNVTIIEPPKEGERTDKKYAHAGGKGLTVALNGGVEGYTSALAPRIRPGPAWGLTVAAAPTRVIGIELGYVGATNTVKDPAVAGLANEPRIIRNGGNVDVKVSAPLPLSPFVFAGIGISRASVQNDAAGYTDDTFGQVPLGAGINWNIGNFSAGARFTYNYLFDRGFTPLTRQGELGFDEKQYGDSYNGSLSVGGTF